MDVKYEFPASKKRVYFDNAVMGLLPESTIRVVEEYNRDLVAEQRGEPVSGGGMQKWAYRKQNSKKLFARVIGASEQEVAFVPNCTTGVNTIFSMLPLKRGSNIVTTDLLFPMGSVVVANQRRRGAEARYIKGRNGIVETRDFEKAVDDKTAVVYLDNPAWFNGLLFDLKALSEIAHDYGAFLVVDATQSFGVLNWDIDRSGVDFAATSTYKWLLGGSWAMSAGFMYIKGEHVDRFQPAYVSGGTMTRTQVQDSVEGYARYEFTPRKGIERFEIYPRTELSYVAVENSMKLLLDLGMDSIERQVKKLDTKLVNGLLESGFELQTPVEESRRIFVNVKLPDPGTAVKKLAERGVAVSNRVGGVRISPHFYNTEEEVETFLNQMNKVAK
jgi:selenocysteine lyase/cysteine desulfurase